MLTRSILQYFWPALCDNRLEKTKKKTIYFLFLSGFLKQVLLYTIKFNGYPIWEVKKIPTNQPTQTGKTGLGKGKQKYFKVGPILKKSEDDKKTCKLRSRQN